MLTHSGMNYNGTCSGDDPSCVGVVQPVEDCPWRPPDVVHHRAHLISGGFYYVHQYEQRHVKHRLLIGTFHNRLHAIIPNV